MYLFKYLIWLFIFSVANSQTTQQKVSTQVQKDLDKINSPELKALKAPKAIHGAGGLVTVGAAADSDCDFNIGPTRIQDAIDSGALEIRLSSEDTFFETLVLDNTDVLIKGGYANCNDAANDQPNGDLTTIDGSLGADPIIQITDIDTNKNTVSLNRLILENGNDSAIDVFLTTVMIELDTVIIRDNTTSSWGGGISVLATDTDVIAHNLNINNNTANSGGGISCQGSFSSFIITGNSTINNNNAIGTGGSTSGTGGGLYLAQSCTFSMYAGGNQSSSKSMSDHTKGGIIFPSFFSNEAYNVGGAINSINDSKLFLFGQQMCVDGQCLGDNSIPIQITSNTSDANTDGDEGGGAIRLHQDGNEAIINGVYLSNNNSGSQGGALLIDDQASLIIYRENKSCWLDIFCNAMFNNETSSALGFGGLLYNDNGQVQIANAFISENRADFGTVVFATGDMSTTRIESSIINDNGDNGANGWSDNHVFYATLGASLDFVHNTIVDNSAELSVFNIDPAGGSTLNLQSSIIEDPSTGDVLNAAAGATTINCLMANESGSFSGTQVVVDDPEFVDPGNGDFSLNPVSSPAIDFCDDSQADIQHRDINFDNRGWDDPNFVNIQGPFDLGADESFANDIIFMDGFE